MVALYDMFWVLVDFFKRLFWGILKFRIEEENHNVRVYNHTHSMKYILSKKKI